MRIAHALRALRAVAGRELNSFVRRPGRLASAAGCGPVFFALALWGYDPQRGTPRRGPPGGPT